MRAAISSGQTALVVVDDVQLGEVRPDEVQVAVSHCGICHSDISMHDLSRGSGTETVLGHEAAGVVRTVGASVTTVVPGDKVLISPIASCGYCYWCCRDEPTLCGNCDSLTSGTRSDGTSPLLRGGAPIQRGLGVGGFGEQTIVNQRALVRLDPDTPLDVVCVIGCSIQTGCGGVFNVARVEPGATVFVAGLGGIGIAVVQAARISGAAKILVSDPVGARREQALALGATEAVDPNEEDVAAWAYGHTDGIGADYAFEAAGVAAVVGPCVQASRKGGTTVILGADVSFASVELLPLQLATEGKKILGSLLGDCHPHRDIPRFVALWKAGALNLEAMISHRLDLADINRGFDNLRAADGIRTVVRVGG